MILYTYDANGSYTGEYLVDNKDSPVPPGLLAPPPLSIPEGKQCVAQDGAWVITDKQKLNIEDTKISILKNLNSEYETRVQNLALGYSSFERESWPVQTAEATAYSADPLAPTPWLDAASAARGIDKAELAARVIAMDTAYRQIHGALTGHRQKLWDQIYAAQTADELTAIDVTAGWPA